MHSTLTNQQTNIGQAQETETEGNLAGADYAHSISIALVGSFEVAAR